MSTVNSDSYRALDPNFPPTLPYSKTTAQSLLDNARIQAACMRPIHTSYR